MAKERWLITGATGQLGGHIVREIARGSVMRTVTLPTGLEADKAEATFEHGVLSLRIPRAEQVKPRQIQIRPVTAGEAREVENGQASAIKTSEA